MTLRNICKLTNKYVKCPACGNDKFGNGEGKLIVEDRVFIRTCKCGHKVVAVEDERGKIIIELP